MKLSVVLFLLSFLIGFSSDARAEEARSFAQISPDVKKIKTAAPERFRLAPIALKGGSHLTLISPESWAPLAYKVSASIIRTHQDFEQKFGDIPPLMTSVHLMDEESFFRVSGAPRWTQALYLRGQIMISLYSLEQVDLDDLFRSVGHEYSHAVVHTLSGGNCPGWLDEGLAQRAEGQVNAALKPALKGWLRQHSPINLSLLAGGFTALDSEMVAPAYAQALFATNRIIDTYGFKALRVFFDGLRKGQDQSSAFKQAFQISSKEFEQQLGEDLHRQFLNNLDHP